MIKLKIHPTFWIFAVIMVFENKFAELLATLIAVIIHEYSHARVAYNLGYYMESLTVMPYGAMLGAKDDFSGTDGVKIAYFGPLANFVTCIILFALWWVFPTTYNYTYVLYYASMTIGTFNLLPLFPLDGARILLSLTKNPLKLLSVFKASGIVISGLLGILFLASFFYTPNYSLGLIGAMLYVSQMTNNDKERFKVISENCPYVKNLDAPIKKYTMVVHYDLKLIRLLKHIKADSDITFEVVDDNLKVVKILTENDVKNFCLKQNLHKPIKEFLYL